MFGRLLMIDSAHIRLIIRTLLDSPAEPSENGVTINAEICMYKALTIKETSTEAKLFAYNVRRFTQQVEQPKLTNNTFQYQPRETIYILQRSEFRSNTVTPNLKDSVSWTFISSKTDELHSKDKITFSKKDTERVAPSLRDGIAEHTEGDWIDEVPINTLKASAAEAAHSDRMTSRFFSVHSHQLAPNWSALGLACLLLFIYL